MKMFLGKSLYNNKGFRIGSRGKFSSYDSSSGFGARSSSGGTAELVLAILFIVTLFGILKVIL